ncbi:MAG: hypothetical protein ACLSHX_07230 [Suilimivivens sp.]
MSKVLKNGITVLVVAVCGFVCLIALLLYASGGTEICILRA